MLLERIRTVTDAIREATARAGRPDGSVKLLSVTKSHPADTVRDALDHGLTVLGENRVQEAIAKFEPIRAELPGPAYELHLIGHLQSNKAAKVPGLFDWVQSVDSIALAQALSRRCDQAGVTIDLLLQFNSSGEQTKSGYADPDALVDDAAAIASLASLRLRGIMTIGPFTDDVRLITDAFARTRALFERVATALPDECIDTLSMGMSDDYRIAIGEGSTLVRIGSALFGARS
ncbi:MAG: YggS family pyridoxal phosphate-dependent enzyme [Spirochaetaceae bacterium]|nr:MAG: YggS family pyridoxal phosphate-dependent enzyme [Spirochaetaceae bacterium]